MRYCVWNNKGGVGKTFLTYCLAVEYAIKHPDRAVAVIDMCPQANISEMLLGGNGPGEANLTKFYESKRTIACYIMDRQRGGWANKIGNEINYFAQVQKFNPNLPNNLYLLPGDFDLDGCAEVIDYVSRSPTLRNAWTLSRTFLRDIIPLFEQQHKKNTAVFIDTNPSFANYTQAGIVAADRLIVPCTADYASIRGICNIFYRIFGINEVNGRAVYHDDMETFYSRSHIAGINLPKIHTFILNKSRSHDRRASAAYTAHVDEITKIISSLVKSHKDQFSQSRNKRIFNIKDGNTLSTVLNYNGLAPSQLQHRRYTVYDGETQVNDTQIVAFQKDVAALVKTL